SAAEGSSASAERFFCSAARFSSLAECLTSPAARSSSPAEVKSSSAERSATEVEHSAEEVRPNFHSPCRLSPICSLREQIWFPQAPSRCLSGRGRESCQNASAQGQPANDSEGQAGDSGGAGPDRPSGGGVGQRLGSGADQRPESAHPRLSRVHPAAGRRAGEQ